MDSIGQHNEVMSLVLIRETPPTPVNVTTLAPPSISATASISRSRPIYELACVGKFPGSSSIVRPRVGM